MTEQFFKVYKKDTNKEVYGSGAILLYKILWANLAKKYWVDKPGCPLKRDYFNNGILACSLSIPLLMELSGYGERKIKGWIRVLIKTKWVTVKRGVRGGRNVFTLGNHDGVGKNYRELLFKDNLLELEPTAEQVQENWVSKMDPLTLLELSNK